MVSIATSLRHGQNRVLNRSRAPFPNNLSRSTHTSGDQPNLLVTLLLFAPSFKSSNTRPINCKVFNKQRTSHTCVYTHTNTTLSLSWMYTHVHMHLMAPLEWNSRLITPFTLRTWACTRALHGQRQRYTLPEELPPTRSCRVGCHALTDVIDAYACVCVCMCV